MSAFFAAESRAQELSPGSTIEAPQNVTRHEFPRAFVSAVLPDPDETFDFFQAQGRIAAERIAHGG